MGQGTMRVAGQTAGWFADPAGRFRFRYWDGGQWTDQVLSSTREEGIDPLEPALRVEPPRPVLPTVPVETNLGGAPVVDPQAATGGSRDRTLRIPRPSPSFIAAMLLVALTAGVAIWLVSKLNDNSSDHPASIQSLVSGSSPNAQYPALQSLGVPDATGLHVVADPAVPGARRVQLSALGISIAIPRSWYAVNGAAPQVRQAAQASGTSADALTDLARVRLFAIDPSRPTVALVVEKLPGDESILGQAKQLKQVVAQSVANVIPQAITVERTKVAGMDALLLHAPISVQTATGSDVIDLTSYFVVTRDGVADISTVAREFDPTAGSVTQSLAASVKKLH